VLLVFNATPQTAAVLDSRDHRHQKQVANQPTESFVKTVPPSEDIASGKLRGKMDGMSEQPKKRPWFQFSLMTAIVIMLMDGGLLWMVCVPFYADADTNIVIYHGPMPPTFLPEFPSLGRPFIFAQQQNETWRWRWTALAADAVLISCITLFVGFICEWHVRRLERKPLLPP